MDKINEGMLQFPAPNWGKGTNVRQGKAAQPPWSAAIRCRFQKRRQRRRTPEYFMPSDSVSIYVIRCLPFPQWRQVRL